MEQQATGRFDVKMTPLADTGNDDASNDDAGVTPVGRMALAKQFHGELDATGHGQMLTAMGGVAGSAGYVALEQVSGSLHGRRGSFVLQHSGTMNRGTPTLSISVVPDTGTGELAGLVGSLQINIVDGKHHYVFDYSLPPVA